MLLSWSCLSTTITWGVATVDGVSEGVGVAVAVGCIGVAVGVAVLWGTSGVAVGTGVGEALKGVANGLGWALQLGSEWVLAWKLKQGRELESA